MRVEKIMGKIIKARLVVALLPILMATTCQKDYIHYADEAYEIEQWEIASKNYEMALRRETADAMLIHIKGRLSECREKAAAAYLRQARDHLILKRYDEAINEVEKARRWSTSPETAKLLVEATQAKADLLLAQGKGLCEQGEYAEAIKAL